MNARNSFDKYDSRPQWPNLDNIPEMIKQISSVAAMSSDTSFSRVRIKTFQRESSCWESPKVDPRKRINSQKCDDAEYYTGSEEKQGSWDVYFISIGMRSFTKMSSPRKRCGHG